MKWLGRILLLTVVGLVVGGVYLAWCAADTARTAERALHAELLAMGLLASFVEQEKRWPHNWDELLPIAPSGGSGMWTWPDDVAEMKKYVEIDFNYDINRLQQATMDGFDGVQVKTANYGRYDHPLDRLKRAAEAD